MADTFSFEEASQSPLDVALQAEGISGDVAEIARSIYQQESSSGKNSKTSNAGAVGGMQILPGTFQRKADKGWDINDPIQNARAGVRYVQEMYDRSGGDAALTAAGYYGGPGGLEKARKGVAVSDPRNPDAPNTLEYGQQVAARLPKGKVATALDKATDAIIPSAQADELPSDKKKAPVTFSFEEAQQPERRGMLDELGRQVGLTARAGISGVAAIPAMLSDALIAGPANAAMDLYDDARAPNITELITGKQKGFRFKRASDALSDTMTAAGLPAPENATERVVQDVAGAMSGTGATVAAGKALAQGGGAVAKGVGDLLAAGPGLQTVSAATGAGASGMTREGGGGQGAQLAAGLVGSMLPVAASLSRIRSSGNKQVAQAAAKANEVGYVIPPADLNPGMATEAASALSGKIKTAQVASQKNQAVTNQLAKKALGLSAADDLSIDALAAIRKKAGESYGAVADAGTITPTASYSQALDDAVKPFTSQAKSFPDRKMPALVDDIQSLKTGQFDAADAVETIKILRNEAEKAYRAGDNLSGGAYKNSAKALEDAIEEHLVQLGTADDVLNGYRNARQTIAKTYTVEKALNPQTGNVNAQTLAGDLKRGKPLSGELLTIAEIGQAFPKATQALKEAPKQVSIMDVASGVGGAAAFANPALAVAPAIARTTARAVLLSKPMQRMAIRSAGAPGTGIPTGIPATAVGAAMRAGSSNDPRMIPMSQRQSAQPYVELRGMAEPEPDHIGNIGAATTIDDAIKAAGAAINQQPKVESKPIETLAPQPPPPPPIPQKVSMTVPGGTSDEPASVWFGRRGDGYQGAGDAYMAMRARQKLNPNLEWRVEEMPSGRYRIAGYGQAEQMTPEGGGMDELQGMAFEAIPRGDGTLAIRGNPEVIRQTLAQQGIRAIPMRDGVIVGVSQAQAAQGLLRQLSEA